MSRIEPGYRGRVPWLVAVSCAGLLWVSGCQPTSSAARPPEKTEEKPSAGAQAEGVALKPEEIERAGIKTTAAVATEHAPETTGYALVITREAIAQVVADLSTAAAVERQSRAALERSRGLAGTPGAVPIEAQETAERQATVDHAALMLAQRRLSAAYGRNAPWKDDYASPELSALASGELKLARVTFPLGALGSGVPPKLRLAHLGAAPSSKSLESNTVWAAPADVSFPGRSFFALIKGDVSEGERLLARAAVGAAESGVVIPFDAVLLNGGKYWCYVEEKPGVFVRTEIDPGAPTDQGYFVKDGVSAGAKIVTTSAGELLARELGSAAAD